MFALSLYSVAPCWIYVVTKLIDFVGKDSQRNIVDLDLATTLHLGIFLRHSVFQLKNEKRDRKETQLLR